MFLGTAWDIRSVTEVELLVGLGGVKTCQTLSNSEYCYISPGVRLWARRSITEREKTQINS